MTDVDALVGELRDELVAAMQRVPELAGRQLVLTTLRGGITNRNFLVSIPGADDRYVIRLFGNDTHLLGISREVEHAATVVAAGVGVGPDVTAFIQPGGIPRHAVHRRLTRQRRVDPRARDPRAGGPIAPAHPRRTADPGEFVPLRIVEAYRALAAARGVAIPDAYDIAAVIGRRIEVACLANPVELRPCHNDLLNANFIDDGARIRIVDWEYAGMGDPFFDLGNFSINHELTPDEDADLLAAYGDGRRTDHLARLTLMRVVSDFREAMWGVLQQGISTLDVDFAEYAGEHFDRLLANATTPAFERALRDAAGD